MSYGAYFVHFLWAMPLMLAMSLYLVYQTVGVSAFAAIGIMTAMAPANGQIAKLFMSRQKALNKVRDERVNFLTEVLQGVRLIKMLAWEEKILSLVGKLRDAEMVYIR